MLTEAFVLKAVKVMIANDIFGTKTFLNERRDFRHYIDQLGPHSFTVLRRSNVQQKAFVSQIEPPVLNVKQFK